MASDPTLTVSSGDVPGTALCLDCGAAVSGSFCQQCGQRRDTRLRSASAVLRSIASEVTDLDTRLYRTLKVLVRQPGHLTVEYLHGRRTRYVPPLRLYLALSVVYFTTFWATGSSRFFIFWASGPDPGLATLVKLLPKLMIVMLPIFAAYLSLLYRRRHAFEGHFVFALHYHAFAFLVLSGVSLLQPAVRALRDGEQVSLTSGVAVALSSALEFWVMVYLYLALRRVHAESRTRTTLKAATLFLAHMVTIAAVGALALPSVRSMIWHALGQGT